MHPDAAILRCGGANQRALEVQLSMARAAAEALEPLAAGVTIVEAATVLCVRRVPPDQFSARTLSHEDYTLDADARSQLGDFEWPFTSGLQVLMGQNEVVNWVRSTPTSTSFMRYAGEWKFPGGSVDKGEALAAAAERELSEEFRLTLPPSAVMEPFNVKFTRAIQGRSYTMFNFLCAADRNPWLQQLDLQAVNARLSARREKFERLLESGEFWQLGKEERMEVSPEVRRVEWLDLATAVEVRAREVVCVWARARVRVGCVCVALRACDRVCLSIL